MERERLREREPDAALNIYDRIVARQQAILEAQMTWEQIVRGRERRWEATPWGRVKWLTGPRLHTAMRTMSRDLVVEAVVDNKGGKLRPGMFAVAHLKIGDVDEAVVPATAVRQDSELARVYLVRDGRAEEHLVQVGRALGGDVAIVSGVRKGDRIVAKLTDDVRDGVKVE